VVRELNAAYDKWWGSVLPEMVNEDAVEPRVNPFKELYEKQLGGRPQGTKGKVSVTRTELQSAVAAASGGKQ